MKLHVNWRHASAQQLKRASADPSGGDMHSLTCADEVSDQREVCRAFKEAPHVPIAKASAVATSNEKSQVDLLLPADIIESDAMDVSSECAFLMPARSKTFQEVWGALRNSRIGVFGPSQCAQMDEGGERKNEVRMDMRP